MEVPRFSHQALLLDDDRILVSGGFTGIANNNVIIPLPLDTVDIYDPKTDQWSTIPLEDQRSLLNRTLKLPDGTVLFVGVGSDASDEQATGAAYGLNTTDLSWRQFADPPAARAFHSMVLLRDGRVMVAGGTDLNAETSSFFSESTNTVDIFDPAANTWQQAAPMSGTSENLWLFSLNDGRVLAIAGEDRPSRDSTVHVQMYDPDSASWVVVDSHDPYYVPTGAIQLSDGRVLVMGQLNEGEATKTGRTVDGELIEVKLRDGREYYGDRLREVFPDAKVYDPDTDTWTATLGSLGARTSGSLTLLQDGRVLVAGGGDSREDEYNGGGYSFTPRLHSTTAVYDPDSNFWSPGPNMAERRSEHSVTLTPDGSVLLLGGIGLVEVGEGREEAVPLNTTGLIDSKVILQVDPAAVAALEAEEYSCETIPIPAPSADLAPAGESLSPKAILSAAHTSMSALDSYHAELRLAWVDDETDTGYALCTRSAIDFQAPDRVLGHYSTFGAWGEYATEIISIGHSVYQTDYTTGKWEWAPLPPVDSANLLEIFGDDTTADPTDSSIIGIERLNDVEVYRIGGTVSAQAFYNIASISGESDNSLQAVFWVGVEDSLVRKVSAEGVIDDMKSFPINISITIEYSAFGEEIVIEAPQVGAAP